MSGLSQDELIAGFLEQATLKFSKGRAAKPIEEWVLGLDLGGRRFTFENHEWQRDILRDESRIIVIQKGAQLGATLVVVLKCLYGLLSGKFPVGALYLFPTLSEVSDFSRSRFAPLLSSNEEIGKQVADVDAIGLKRIGQASLFFRGCRATTKIEGIKASSSALKGIPADALFVDEVDEMDEKLLDLARERLSHSEVRSETYLSTPSLPGYGIAARYLESDGKIWQIRCQCCGKDTCLELSFPSCIQRTSDGRAFRACQHCGKEIFVKDGHWVPQWPGREISGYWISQLCSPYIPLEEILRMYEEGKNPQEFHNSKLGVPYVPSEARLTPADVFSCCQDYVMLAKHPGPSCCGVDVGSDRLYVTVGYRPKEGVIELPWLGQVKEFGDLSALAARFNIQSMVIDFLPETRSARQFSASQQFPVFLCTYNDNASGIRWDDPKRMVSVNRTEHCDWVHESVSRNLIVLPRRNPEVEELAKHLTNLVKISIEEEGGSKVFRYRAIGPDHFFHSLGYLQIASEKIGIASDQGWWARKRNQVKTRTGISWIDRQIEANRR